MGTDITLIGAVGYVVPRAAIDAIVEQLRLPEEITDDDENWSSRWGDIGGDTVNLGVECQSSYNNHQQHDCYFFYLYNTRKYLAGRKIGGSTIGLVPIEQWDIPCLHGGARLPMAFGLHHGGPYSSFDDDNRKKDELLEVMKVSGDPVIVALGVYLKENCVSAFNDWMFSYFG